MIGTRIVRCGSIRKRGHGRSPRALAPPTVHARLSSVSSEVRARKQTRHCHRHRTCSRCSRSSSRSFGSAHGFQSICHNHRIKFGCIQDLSMPDTSSPMQTHLCGDRDMITHARARSNGVHEATHTIQTRVCGANSMSLVSLGEDQALLLDNNPKHVMQRTDVHIANKNLHAPRDNLFAKSERPRRPEQSHRFLQEQPYHRHRNRLCTEIKQVKLARTNVPYEHT